MSRNLIAFFLLMALICVTAAGHSSEKPKQEPKCQCQSYEVYKDCGTSCEATCKNPNPTCAQVCVKGCFCKDGQLRNSEGKCVDSCDC